MDGWEAVDGVIGEGYTYELLMNASNINDVLGEREMERERERGKGVIYVYKRGGETDRER